MLQGKVLLSFSFWKRTGLNAMIKEEITKLSIFIQKCQFNLLLVQKLTLKSFFSLSFSCVWRYFEHTENYYLAHSFFFGISAGIHNTNKSLAIRFVINCTTSALGSTKYLRLFGPGIPVKFLILWIEFTHIIKSWILPLKCHYKLQNAIKGETCSWRWQCQPPPGWHMAMGTSSYPLEKPELQQSWELRLWPV